MFPMKHKPDENKVVTKEEVQAFQDKHPTPDLQRFIDTIRDGDEIHYSYSKGCSVYYVSKGSFMFRYVISVMMS